MEISDEYMLEQLSQARAYSLVLLHLAPGQDPEAIKGVVWEHGRRNFSLRAEGVLNIVCPATDDSALAGVGIFSASVEETRRIMDGDPGVVAGVFTYEIHPVRGFPGDRLAADT